MGTHHICPKCGNSYICDQADCILPGNAPCLGCDHDQPTWHSQFATNMKAAEQRLAAELRRREKPQEYQRELFQAEMF